MSAIKSQMSNPELPQMVSSVNLQLGDIIQLEAPTNSGLHDKVYFIKFINSEKIVLDMKSFLYLAGTELDFSDGLNGKGFNFINPNATRTCGCGESFAV